MPFLLRKVLLATASAVAKCVLHDRHAYTRPFRDSRKGRPMGGDEGVDKGTCTGKYHLSKAFSRENQILLTWILDFARYETERHAVRGERKQRWCIRTRDVFEHYYIALLVTVSGFVSPLVEQDVPLFRAARVFLRVPVQTQKVILLRQRDVVVVVRQPPAVRLH